MTSLTSAVLHSYFWLHQYSQPFPHQLWRMVINGKRVKFVSLVLLVGNLEGNLRHPTNPKERVSWLKISLSHVCSHNVNISKLPKYYWLRICWWSWRLKMVIWYCEPPPLFVSAQHKKMRHTSQILRPFTFPLNRKDENSKTHSKRSSQIEICGSG